jgi:hypothetical protein
MGPSKIFIMFLYEYNFNIFWKFVIKEMLRKQFGISTV